MGFAMPPTLPWARWALTPPFHPYRRATPLRFRTRRGGGLFSVALSSALPPPAVSRHRALWSSDFPPAAASEPTAAGDHPCGVDAPEIAPWTPEAQAVHTRDRARSRPSRVRTPRRSDRRRHPRRAHRRHRPLLRGLRQPSSRPACAQRGPRHLSRPDPRRHRPHRRRRVRLRRRGLRRARARRGLHRRPQGRDRGARARGRRRRRLRRALQAGPVRRPLAHGPRRGGRAGRRLCGPLLRGPPERRRRDRLARGAARADGGLRAQRHLERRRRDPSASPTPPSATRAARWPAISR